MPDIDRQAYIDRDKKALISIVQEKIAQNAEKIVERWYKLSDIGFLPQEEKFLDLLKEAEQLYSFGFYTGTIAGTVSVLWPAALSVLPLLSIGFSGWKSIWIFISSVTGIF